MFLHPHFDDALRPPEGHDTVDDDWILPRALCRNRVLERDRVINPRKPKRPWRIPLRAAAVIFQIDEISIHNRVIIWEAVFGSVGRSNVTFFFLSLSSVDEAIPPWMWGKTVGGRSQQPRNTSPPPIASLPLSHKHGNPPHSVSRTHARSLPQPRWEKTWPHRAPSSRRGETRRKVYAELKKE